MDKLSEFLMPGRNINADHPIKVGLFGQGKSNSAVMRYIKKYYANAKFILHSKAIPKTDLDGIDRIYFDTDEFTYAGEDVIFLSPSVKFTEKRFSEYLKRNIKITSDCDMFFFFFFGDFYLITGSEGKSTTATLSNLIMSHAHSDCKLIGNIGEALSGYIDDACEKFIIEMSSFQLSGIKPPSVRAMITNISENHLDFHENMNEYINAKLNIFPNCKEKIICFDDKTLTERLTNEQFYASYSMHHTQDEVRKNLCVEICTTIEDGYIKINKEKIIKVKDIKNQNPYHIQNFMAAMTLCWGNYDKKAIYDIASSFYGLSHRCETVGTYNGVKFIDSTIDTTPTRTLTTLSSMKEPVILLLGGKSKNLNYDILWSTVKEKAKSVVIYGENRNQLYASFKRCVDSQLDVKIFNNLYSAVKHAKSIAKSTDTVLLSPASSSYDEFDNYEQKAAAYKKYIKH